MRRYLDLKRTRLVGRRTKVVVGLVLAMLLSTQLSAEEPVVFPAQGVPFPRVMTASAKARRAVVVEPDRTTRLAAPSNGRVGQGNQGGIVDGSDGTGRSHALDVVDRRGGTFRRRRTI